MVNFGNISKKAEEAKKDDTPAQYPGWTSVEPGTQRIFKIIDIRPNQMPNRRPEEPEIVDVCDLEDKQKYSLNMPTVLRKKVCGHDETGERNFQVGDYLYVSCPQEKSKSRNAGKTYWDFTVYKPSEQEVTEALTEAAPAKKGKK